MEYGVPWRVTSPLALEQGTVVVILYFALQARLLNQRLGISHQGLVRVMQSHQCFIICLCHKLPVQHHCST